MTARVKISAILACLGLLLAFMPSRETRLLRIKPQRLMTLLNDEKSWLTVDQVARFVVNEDRTVQLIDLRPTSEFMRMNIPGSINIPFSEFAKKIPVSFTAGKNMKNILYSNEEDNAREAFMIARGMNYQNTFIMKGGLGEWQNTIMNTSFTGERISARENALFETRTRARKMFVEFNSMPDSLKQKYFASKQLERKKLDGGCE
jgi:rhodanese-related sulfurtransferase